jgi:SAM-dependent methyltransferase
MPALAPPADPVSIAVRAQYEANPYPRWLDVNPPQPGESRARLRRHAGPSGPQRFAGPLDVLIAGCGTGRHAIMAAFGYRPDARVLAIDLSAASLAYAERQAARVGCRGIEFMQADILDLDRLARDFDVIESSGVLHHLADPLLGWRRLAARLKPGGLMEVALYSERARQDVVAARAEIARLGLPTTRAGIQRFRRLVIEAPNDAADWRTSLRRFGDIYTASGTRDLVFNVQEHRFTPRAIAEALRTLDLDFAGPEMTPPARDAYRQRFPEDPMALDLEKLERFEADNPDVFAGMITFWCRRKN